MPPCPSTNNTESIVYFDVCDFGSPALMIQTHADIRHFLMGELLMRLAGYPTDL